MTQHGSNVSEAVASARPIPGTRYALGSYAPTVGLTARPRPVHVLVLDGVVVSRGSKADLTLSAKSAPDSPLGACHARFDAIVSAS